MERVKYPRTPHLEWSRGLASDDIKVENVEHFVGKEVVVTEKLDGENTSLYSDGSLHARSIDGRNHPSRNWIKASWACRSWLIDDDLRICGENMFAKHSIFYDDLDDLFYGFGVYEDNYAHDWDITKDIIETVGYPTPCEFYRGIYDQNLLIEIARALDPEKVEGYVVRTTEGFHINEFQTHVAKYVRERHVQTDNHWMFDEIVRNEVQGQISVRNS